MYVLIFGKLRLEENSITWGVGYACWPSLCCLRMVLIERRRDEAF